MPIPMGFRNAVTTMLVLSIAAQFGAVHGQQNNYPIVLVHGFLGWGRTELLGYKYWGGLLDIEADLKGQGYSVFTVAVGPFSSNWDRACEMYAQLKGGQVDYGQAHSTLYGHARLGKTHTALYPNWGTADASGNLRKVNLVCHSMGGQTCRMLATLLNEGFPAESGLANSSPLFQGGKDWVHSVTTLAAPHDGTTLATGIDTFLPFVKDTVGVIAGLAGVSDDITEQIFDLKLDQWGLVRQPNERLSAYIDRMFASPVFNEDQKDLSLWDLSPDGAQEINQWVTTLPNVYYLSYATSATYRDWLTRKHLPELFMFPVFWPFALFMGRFTRPSAAGQVPIDSSWWENDGVVNTRSTRGPSNAQITQFTGTFHLNRWNLMRNLEGWDHFDVLGTGDKFIKYRSRDLAYVIKTLPPMGNKRQEAFTPSDPDVLTIFTDPLVSSGPRVDSIHNAQKQREMAMMLCNGSYTEVPVDADQCVALLEQMPEVPEPTVIAVISAGSRIPFTSVLLAFLVCQAVIVF